ncbi:MAG: hypothetical protein WCK78_06895 [Paludibacter sp.]
MNLRVLFVMFAALLLTTGFAQTKSIENELLSLELTKNSVSVKSKEISDVQIKNIQVEGNVVSCKKSKSTDSKWGIAQQLTVEYDNGRTLTYRLFPSNPFLFIHTSIRNTGKTDLVLKQMTFAKVDCSVKNLTNLNTLGTGGMAPLSSALGSYTYSLVADPESRNAVLVSWLTQLQGLGYMTPKQQGFDCDIEAGLEFGNYVVKPGQTRSTDELLIGIFADGREGLELYADYLAKSYQIHLPKKPNVYCTWYHRDVTGSGASTEKALKENARFAAQNLAPYGLNVMQIDDHWQSSMIDGIDYKNNNKQVNGIKLGDGPIKSFTEANFNFPSGMDYTAKSLNKEGFTAGLWFMPFSGDVHHPSFDKNIFAKNAKTGEPYEVKQWSGTCIDATSPAGEAFLRKRFKRIYDWGYRYFKIDGLHTGAPSENIYITRTYKGKPSYGDAKLYNNDMTYVQCFRKGLSLLKEEAPNAFLLGCAATQNMSLFASSFGFVDAMRVGPDNDSGRTGNWQRVTAGADFAGNLYFLNNKVWYNDPDPYYIRESNPLNKARWMLSWQSVSGSLSTTSEQYADLSAERLDMIKRGLPTHSLPVRPVDILENVHPAIWLVHNERMNIIGLFNWKEHEQTKITYSLNRMGLDENKEYEIFDFWANKYLGKMKSQLQTVLDSASCQVLAVKESKDYPQIISTSRHITQGLMDVISENWDSKLNTLSGKSNGVAGDVYEFRLIVPTGYKIKDATCNGTSVKINQEGTLYRVQYIPTITGEFDWRFSFFN